MEPFAQIRETAAGGRLSHAWLLLGGSAARREELARFTAAALLCAAPEGKPCGRCAHCRKLAGGVHPDLYRLERAPGKAEITVDQVRALRQEAWVLPNEAARRVFLIPEADTMNPSAQNALLKLLEEPPAHAAFLLLGENPGAFLATVRSRCTALRADGEEAAAEISDEAAQLAEAFLRGDRLAFAAASFRCEKLDKEKFDGLLEALAQAAGLRAKAGGGEERKRALALAAFVGRLQDMRRVHVSPGHCLGWLSAMIGETPETELF